ncbi:hypothetical protein SLS64_014327 [Diaporthe eres]
MSSLGAMTGQWGQANYNAGNTFLDAFVSYRHSLGLAASVVNIGVVGDVGYVSENPSVLDSLRATGQYIMREPELLTAWSSCSSARAGFVRRHGGTTRRPRETSINTSRDVPLRSAIAARDRPALPAAHHLAQQSHAVAQGPAHARLPQHRAGRRRRRRRRLGGPPRPGRSWAGSSATPRPTWRFCSPGSGGPARARGRQTLLGFMMRAEGAGPRRAAGAVGIDSLVSIELKNWIRRRIGAEVTCA